MGTFRLPDHLVDHVLQLYDRGSVARRRYGDDYITIAIAPEIARVGRSGRAALAKRRTTIDVTTRKRVQDLVDAGLSLRAIGRELGVSHESARTVLHELVAGD